MKTLAPRIRPDSVRPPGRRWDIGAREYSQIAVGGLERDEVELPVAHGGQLAAFASADHREAFVKAPK